MIVKFMLQLRYQKYRNLENCCTSIPGQGRNCCFHIHIYSTFTVLLYTYTVLLRSTVYLRYLSKLERFPVNRFSESRKNTSPKLRIPFYLEEFHTSSGKTNLERSPVHQSVWSATQLLLATAAEVASLHLEWLPNAAWDWLSWPANAHWLRGAHQTGLRCACEHSNYTDINTNRCHERSSRAQ